MASVRALTCSKAFGGDIEPLGFDFQIMNAPTPYVVLRMHPGKKFIAESGTMMKKTPAIEMDVGIGNGGEKQGLFGSLLSGMTRKLAGEKFLTQVFTNKAAQEQDLLLSAAHPGQILAVDLHRHNNTLICQRGAFMAAPGGTDVTFHIRQKLGFALFGGEEFVMQKITGDDVVFLSAGGGLYAEDLDPGEEIQVDSGCLVATTADVSVSIRKAGTIKNMVFGDEGFVLVNCTGPGRVWMQSMPFSLTVASITSEQARQAEKGAPRGARAAVPD